MEKHVAHYSLEDIKAAIRLRGQECFTATARDGIRRMGLTDAAAIEIVLSLPRSAFYKSMTTHIDHRIWQDAYHASTPNGMAYVKFTLREDGAIVISFKAL